MPGYRFGKGPIAVTLEDYLSDRDRVIALLKELHTRTTPSGYDFVKVLTERFPGAGLHFLHVLGVEFPEGLSVKERKTAEREGSQRLKVFGNGLRMAASLALGIAPNVDPSEIDIKDCQEPPHPIDIFWGCGHPFNQSWVSSRPYRDARMISLVFYTTQPAMDEPWEPLGVRLTDEELGMVSADRLLLVCSSEPDRAPEADAAWFRPGDERGIPRPRLSPQA